MNVQGMSADEKLHFLDVLINRTNPYHRERFYALYIVLGDDIFLVFSILSELSIRWPNEKDFKSAQLSTKALSNNRGSGKKGPEIPQVTKFWDITAMENKRFWHVETGVLTPASKLKKFEKYWSEEINDNFYPLTKTKNILGREWILCTDSLKEVVVPRTKARAENWSDGPEDFIS